MTLSQIARTSYARTDTTARSPRALEYDLLARSTQSLTRAWRQRRQDFPGLAKALAENQQLWSALAVDVAGNGNGLPATLRAKLFYLYEFTAQHSRQILEGNGGVEVLVDINMAVMRGLRGEAGAGAAG